MEGSKPGFEFLGTRPLGAIKVATAPIFGLGHTGEDSAKVDSKNRLLITKPKRDYLCPAGTSDFVFVIGDMGQIICYPVSKFNEIFKPLLEPEMHETGKMDLAREILGTSVVGRFDNVGRCVLPQSLCKRAKINVGEEVIVIGAPGHIELWSKAQRELFFEDTQGYNEKWRAFIQDARTRMREGR